MFIRLVQALTNTDDDLLLKFVEFVQHIHAKRATHYVPFQAWDWHPMYKKRTIKDPAVLRLKRELSLPYEWTPAYREWLTNFFNQRCPYCGRGKTEFHIDHIIPVSWETCPGAVVDNGVLSCATCNRDRGNTDLATWHLETFGDDLRTQRVVERVWRAQSAARHRFGPEDGPTRRDMRKEGRAILQARLRSAKKSSTARK